jgi:hypothetical protein
MKNKIENLIKEVGINKVEAILNQMKSKVNVKENLKKDFVELLTGCTISFNNNDDDYKKDNKILFFYSKNKNYFYIDYQIWTNFELKYNLNYQELRDLVVSIVEEVLNYKGVTPVLWFGVNWLEWRKYNQI